MQKIAKFDFVSFDQFKAAYNKFTEEEVREYYENLRLPERSTKGSAGYDFKSPVSFYLEPGHAITIPTGIRAKIEDGWFLMCLPRSGMGFKYQICLANSVGIIDADFYNSDNEGHIHLKLVNRGDKTVTVDAGDNFAQGIFVPFGITYDDAADGIRNGGFGSTGR